jgi:AcrR family transcriptional regulator
MSSLFMPRPRTVPDADVLAAATRAITRVGPGKLTLADIGREAGLSPATLVQRFGSKRGLLLALAELAAGSVDECFARARAENPSPLAALLSAATEMSRYTRSPEEMANHLAYLQIDLSDPDFYRLLLENSRRSLAGYRALLDEAVAAGELLPCDTAALARVVAALSGGSMIVWAVFRKGTAEQWARADLAAVLSAYRPRQRRAQGRVEFAKAASPRRR